MHIHTFTCLYTVGYMAHKKYFLLLTGVRHNLTRAMYSIFNKKMLGYDVTTKSLKGQINQN